MRDYEAAQQKTPSALIMSRELALAADRSLWADNQKECVAIVARLYDLFDNLERGFEPDPRTRVIAADTAAWIGDKGRCAELLGDVLA